MALIKCKECGAEVSSSALLCPKCGANGTYAIGLGWVDKLLVAIVCVAGIYVALFLDLGFLKFSAYGLYIRLFGYGVFLVGGFVLFALFKKS